jgi:hypothetical protein
MLLFAALIESYVRQSHWSTGARLGFAAATGVFWVLYFVHGMYRERAARVAPKSPAADFDKLSPGEAASPVTAGSAGVVQRID